MLRSICAVTYSVSNFNASCHALENFFAYRRGQSGRIEENLAHFWGAPGVAGNRYATFEPASAEPVLIRLVEQPATPGYEPLKTFGWNAAELHVEDVHTLSESLVDSPFRVLGGPRDLLNDGTAVALQTLGPSGEVFYLTEINGLDMQRTYGKAESRIGRLFIAVLGSGDHDAALMFYAALTEGTTPPKEFPIRVLAAAHGLNPQATRFPIASAILQEKFRIEIDGYPATAVPRPVTEGLLPPGLSLVSFCVGSLSSLPVELLRKSAGFSEAPYFDRPTGLLRGPDGELLELISSPG
jgi:hypothetical protein